MYSIKYNECDFIKLKSKVSTRNQNDLDSNWITNGIIKKGNRDIYPISNGKLKKLKKKIEEALVHIV